VGYLSCGYSNLWKISAAEKKVTKIENNNIALGIDAEAEFTEISTSWELDDCLIIGSFASDQGEEQLINFFEKLVQENTGKHSPQKIIDKILRNAKLALSKSSQQRTISFIGVARTEV
jgi:serine phosphatase RsbU (regulator of sigma subunit)